MPDVAALIRPTKTIVVCSVELLRFLEIKLFAGNRDQDPFAPVSQGNLC